MRANHLSLFNVFPLMLLLGLFAMTARNAVDPDLWWHLRTGQWIVETGHVPHSDPFSFTRAGHAWVSHEWLSEVAFYELWKHGGAAALIVFSAIVTTAGFMLLYLRCLPRAGKTHWAAAATVFGALASAPSWGVRPQMFTFTLASLLLWLVESGEHRPRLLLWIPPLFLLWLNLHAGFALGPALLFAYGVGLILETAVGDTPWQQVRPIVLRVLLLLLACLALVPLNPSGAQLYRYPFDTLRSPGMRSFIVEWHSPNFHEWLYRPFLLVWLLALTVLASSRSRPKGRVIIPLVLTSFAALDAVRHIPIFVLLAIPVIAAASPAAIGDRGESPHVSKSARRRAPNSSRLRPLFNGAVVILIAVFALVRWTILSRNQDARETEQFPEKAVAFLRSGDYPQKVFAYYDWGGYAVWKLYPAYRVFVDGRADLYGDDLLRQFQTVVQLRNGWRDVLDGWKVEAVLVPPSCAIAQALLLDPEWHLAFSDSKAVVLLKRHLAVESADILHRPLVTGRNVKKCFPEPPKSAKLRHMRTWGLVPTLVPEMAASRMKLEGV
ncbi:MAG TPA: hypothetical protein VJW96_09765 [Terriglobales bacterium]|nr:hypothetical protein [Terriglobales bacterium]